MHRRTFVTGTATLAATSGCLERLERDANGDESADDRPAGPPFELQAVDAPGSEAGTVRVPTADQVQLLNHSRMACPTSRAFLSEVHEARDRLADTDDVGPDGTVHVVTLMDGSRDTQPTPDELADWWADQDGDWTVAIDEHGALFDHHEVSVRPTTVAVDGTGEIHWRDEGGTIASNVVSGVERALEASEARRVSERRARSEATREAAPDAN